MLKKIKSVVLIASVALTLPSIGLAFAPGFLAKAQYPNSLAILPPPPAFDSINFLRDKANYDSAISFHDVQRLKQVVNDADLSSSNVGHPFSQALGVEINAKNTPVTHRLLDRLGSDTDNSANMAKFYYNRIRPFMLYNTQSCTPKEDAHLRTNGSYPSGHTGYGWATALVLSQIRPNRQQQLLKRGYEFGQSRVLCRAHWQSDVDAGYLVGAAVVARLQSNPEFIQSLAEAKAEIHRLVAQQKLAKIP